MSNPKILHLLLEWPPLEPAAALQRLSQLAGVTDGQADVLVLFNHTIPDEVTAAIHAISGLGWPDWLLEVVGQPIATERWHQLQASLAGLATPEASLTTDREGIVHPLPRLEFGNYTQLWLVGGWSADGDGAETMVLSFVRVL